MSGTPSARAQVPTLEQAPLIAVPGADQSSPLPNRAWLLRSLATGLCAGSQAASGKRGRYGKGEQRMTSVAHRSQGLDRIMKRALTAVILLYALSGVTYSQNASQTDKEQPEHPGTAILDSMGIFAGNPATEQKAPQAEAEKMPATRVSESATKQ